MTNKTLFKMNDAFQEMKGISGNITFSIFVAKNIKLIEEEVELLKGVIPQVPEYNSVYEKQIEDILKEYADKDETGKVIKRAGETGLTSYAISENKNLILEKIKELESQDEIKDILSRKKEQVDKITELEEKESELKLHTISKDNLPDELSAKMVQPILELIVD